MSIEIKQQQKILNQIALQNQMVLDAKVNLVTCGSCGSVMLHEINQEEIECAFCDFKSEPCNFPDYFYNGFEFNQ